MARSWRHPQRGDGGGPLTLRDLPNGAFARIVQIVSPQQVEEVAGSSRRCSARLEALGLRTGKIVQKVSGMPFHGPVTLLLDGRQIAVGWNISAHVLVIPLKEREGSHGLRPERD